MSSLWTPGGEHPVPPARPTAPPASSQHAAPPFSQAPLYSRTPLYSQAPVDDDDWEDSLSPEQEAELRAMQEQLISVPAASVIANHVVNIFQLAMLHLFAEPPKFEEASLAIDAATAIVDKLNGRLGPDEPTLVDAVHQMRLAFVQVRNSQE